MSPVASGDAWRAFSLAVEAAFGTPQTVDTSLPWTGDLMDSVPDKQWDNKDEFTGELAPTARQALTWKLAWKHAQLAQPHNLALFLAMVLGKHTPSQVQAGPPAIYKHKFNMDKTVVTLPSRTAREYVGGICLEYPGLICNDLSVSGEPNDFVKLEAAGFSMGKEIVITPAPSRPSQVSEAYLQFGDVDIRKGGAYNGTAVSGGTSVKARVRSFKIGIKNGSKERYYFGVSQYSGDPVRGRMPDLSLALKLDFADGSEKASFLAGDTFVMEIPIVGGIIDAAIAYEARFIYPKVAYNKAAKGHDDGLLTLDSEFLVMADATYGPLDVFVQNCQADYL